MKFRIDMLETYEFAGRTVRRLICTEAFGDVAEGDKGGWLEKEANLSQEGDAWVYDNAIVWADALVTDGAKVRGSLRIGGNVIVRGGETVSIENVAEKAGMVKETEDGITGTGFLK